MSIRLGAKLRIKSMNNIIYALFRLSRRSIVSTGLVENCARMRSQFILLHYFINVILKNVIEAICIRDRPPSPALTIPANLTDT